MNFTLDPSGTSRQRAWVNDAIASCAYPLDAIDATVTVVWSSSSPCGLAHPYMCTTDDGDRAFTITIEPWADDPTNPNLRGLTNPTQDVKEFYLESLVHEIGHIVHYTFITDDDLRSQIAALFWTPEPNSATGRRWGALPDYAPAETSTLRWASAIIEAIAECVKCTFYRGSLIYMNRSEWRIDPQEWPAFTSMILPAPSGSFDEHWQAPLDADAYAAVAINVGLVTFEGQIAEPGREAGYQETSFLF